MKPTINTKISITEAGRNKKNTGTGGTITMTTTKSAGNQAHSMKKNLAHLNQSATSAPASQLIDERIHNLTGWRGEMLSHLRALIRQAVPGVLEECKWRKPSNPLGVPVWSHQGILCTGEVYKSSVKLTFAKGAFLPDPAGLFNASLEGNLRRAIDFHEGDPINEKALKALIRAAAALNASKAN